MGPTFDGTWRIGDILTFAYVLLTAGYLVATVRIFRSTRDALEINRDSLNEIKGTRQSQVRAAFETTFFAMLQLHRDLTTRLAEGGHSGYELLRRTRSDIRSEWSNTLRMS